MDEIVKDERFKHIVKDQRFKVLPKNERKVKIDKRFKNMFHDKKFKLKYTVDKRGRPTDLTTNDNLKKYYELSSEEDEDEEEDDENENEDKPGTSKEKNLGKVKKEETKTKTEVKKKEEEKDVSSEDENESESEEESSEDEEEDGKKDEEKEDEEEESEDESDDDESVNQEEEIEEIPWNELDKDTYRDEKTSRRLAVCNMDWDRIKAVDLYVIFNSFKPAQGVLKSIKIYISDYGKERLAYEKLHGPKELTEETSNVNKSNEENQETKEEERFEEESDNDSDKSEFDEDGDDFDRRKLRIYQFNRLRYYYAIIECDNEQTAEKIYSECDGMEYESSCNRVDLRFVPDDTEFDEADVRDSCTEAPDPISYKPNLFFTTALNQTRVECTWDETPHERLALTMKKYTEDELKNSDFRGILATSSEEEDNDDEEEERKAEAKKEEEKKKEKESDQPVSEEERIRRFREMLLGAEAAKSKPKKNRDADLEFDWEGGAIKEDGFDEELFDGGDKKKANSSKKFGKKHDKKRELTEEEKREQAQLSMLTMDDEDNKAHFNLDDLLVDKKHKKGRKSQHEETKTNQDDFKLNLEDPRFQAIFTSHKFNIDPSDQSFKKTKAMENLLDAKIKRMENSAANGDEESNKDDNNNSKKLISDESLLVKSIKSKTEVLKRKREENQEKLKLKSKRF